MDFKLWIADSRPFAQWAFQQYLHGQNFEESHFQQMTELLEAWDSKHVDLLIVNPFSFDSTEQSLLLEAQRKHPKDLLVFTPFLDQKDILPWVRAGAKSILSELCSIKEIETAIHSTLFGQRFYCPRILDVLAKPADKPLSNIQLSLREKEVLEGLCKGYSGPEIADRLCISPHTVHSHRKNLHVKLNVHSIAELTRVAIENNLLP